MDEAEAPQDMPNDQTVQKQVHVGRNVQPDQALPVPSKGVNETPQRPRSQPGFTGLPVNRGQALGVRHCGRRRTTVFPPQGKNLLQALLLEVSLQKGAGVEIENDRRFSRTISEAGLPERRKDFRIPRSRAVAGSCTKPFSTRGRKASWSEAAVFPSRTILATGFPLSVTKISSPSFARARYRVSWFLMFLIPDATTKDLPSKKPLF